MYVRVGKVLLVRSVAAWPRMRIDENLVASCGCASCFLAKVCYQIP